MTCSRKKVLLSVASLLIIFGLIICRGAFALDYILIQIKHRPADELVELVLPLLSEGGKEIILSILGDGDFFGEMSLLDGEPRSATVIAMKDSTMLVIQRNDFLKQLKQNPTIATGVLSEMSRRIRRADQRIGNLILLDVFGRVARFLLDLAKREGVRYDDGILIERRPTQQDIASMIGASRETVSRVLNELNRRGLISISGKSVMIYGPEDIIEDDGELRFPSEKVEV